MGNLENIFAEDVKQLTAVDVDAPISRCKTRTCEFYVEPYSRAAQDAENKGQTMQAAVFRFLQVIASFCPSFDTPAHPFIPMWQMDGKRSLLPDDLSASDVEVVRVLAGRTADAALRARLHDVLWELTNDHTAGAEAARSYIAAAEELDLSGERGFSVRSFQRGLDLARKFGRSKQLYGDVVRALVAAAKRAATGTDHDHCCHLMRLMLRAGVGEPTEFAGLASSLAAAADARGDSEQAQACWEVEAEWQKRANDAEAERKVRILAAEAAVKKAEARTQGAGASFMAGAAVLREAIESLRRAGGEKGRIEELRCRLNEWQQRSLGEFQTFSTGVDISKLVTEARERVRSGDIRQAILMLAFGHGLSDPKRLKEDVMKAAKAAPLTYLMGGVMVDEQGRTTLRKESLLNLQGEQLETALEAEAFSHAARFHWPLRVDAFITPARLQVLNDHKPTFHDLLFAVHDNPFVPPRHEGVFLRGLHAGFHGDFLVASHLLTPQIENSLRYVLESQGVDVSNLMSDGTQPVKLLGTILGMPETVRILGPSLCFELRGCLIEKAGYDYRNRIAHGFASEGECYSHAGVTVWWLVLRICVAPFFQALTGKRDGQICGASESHVDEG